MDRYVSAVPKSPLSPFCDFLELYFDGAFRLPGGDAHLYDVLPLHLTDSASDLPLTTNGTSLTALVEHKGEHFTTRDNPSRYRRLRQTIAWSASHCFAQTALCLLVRVSATSLLLNNGSFIVGESQKEIGGVRQ